VLPPGAPDSILARNKHGVYCVPRAARARLAARVTLEGEVWESDTVDLVAGVDPTGDIVHAGTFFGDFLPAFAASRADGAIVWAFEPGEQNRRCTEITISLNGLENVKLTPAGLSASEGSALLAVGDRDGTPLGGASRLISDPSRLRWWDSERVRLVAVDDVVPADRRVAAIPLDVEGHEQEALQGALATIVRWRPLIVLETMPAPAWVAEHLTPLGYTPQQPVDRNVVLRCA
jgi:FkbM family methyltransferase